jgi:LuxR family transcriptional regulator, maltose regulon positive regulatory protein
MSSALRIALVDDHPADDARFETITVSKPNLRVVSALSAKPERYHSAREELDVPRPALFERLAGAGRVTEVSAPAGSGKTFLLRSWIREAGLAESAAWVSAGRVARDPRGFWLSVLGALRDTEAGMMTVRGLTPAPDLDCWAIVERLLEDLRSLESPVWLVIDDVHELRSSEALRELELLLTRAPAQLRFVLITRHDLQLGLHRLRLEGGLTEIRAANLRFTQDEALELLEGAGVKLSDSALAALVERTEGWAAGLRLAALSLAGHPDPDGHPDPEGFAAQFSGRERTVAEYLLAEVLERQPEEVRRLLLRTSVLERMTGPLADLLTGDSGGEAILQELEEANAFVVSVDASRTWFRYHRLFADLLALELRRTAPAEVPALHSLAAEWLAEHGYPVEAVRQAQAAKDWTLAARLLSDHWFGLFTEGQAAAAHELLTGFPADAFLADPELAALAASDHLVRGSLEEAARQLTVAARRSASVPAERGGHLQRLLAWSRLSLARRRVDLPAVVEEAQRLLAPDAAQAGLSDEYRAATLINLGIAELWTDRLEEAERHLEQATILAHRIDRPYLEIMSLAHSAQLSSRRSCALGVERSVQTIELARRQGWSEEPVVAVAHVVLGATMVWQGRLGEAEPWLEHAERTLAAEVQPAAGLELYCARGVLELVRGHNQEALEAFRAVERLAGLLVAPGDVPMQALRLQTLVRLGDIGLVEQALADLDEQARGTGEMCIALAVLRLAQNDPEAATVALAPVLDGSADVMNPRVWMVQAFLLEAIARDALGDAGATERALEEALDLAEPDGVLLPFLLHQTPRLLERHCRHRTTHASLISEILNLQGGRKPASPLEEPDPLDERLSESETRILRYLPTNLSKREIADELYVSINTVKAHIRHLYAKLDVNSRGEAVERARALSLLAPSSSKR